MTAKTAKKPVLSYLWETPRSSMTKKQFNHAVAEFARFHGFENEVLTNWSDLNRTLSPRDAVLVLVGGMLIAPPTAVTAVLANIEAKAPAKAPAPKVVTAETIRDAVFTGKEVPLRSSVTALEYCGTAEVRVHGIDARTAQGKQFTLAGFDVHKGIASKGANVPQTQNLSAHEEQARNIAAQLRALGFDATISTWSN